MKKRLIATVALLAVGGGLAWFLLHHWVSHDASLPAFSDKEFHSKEAPEVTLAPLTATNIVRLAIGGLGLPNDQSGALGDLVTVELNGAKGLELVDRQALAAVLREQELGLSGLVRARDAVRIGKLVRADWFLLGSAPAIGGTNLIVARIVDVRTGIIRDIDVLQGATGLTQTATALAGFVRQCREAAATLRPRVYLAVGGFADVGVNHRQAAFPEQLRAYLNSAYQRADLTLLERDSVSALLQEVRLDLAGLTEPNGTNQPPPLRSAFWLVDGFYQSFETTGFEVELILRVNRAFGESTQLTLRGPPESLFPRVKDTIDQTLAKATAPVAGPTRRREINQQMQMGKDLLTAAWGNLWGGLNWGNEQDHPRRQHNVEEAQRAFETVLLLEHDNREAKYYLGACLADWTVGRYAEARNYFLELTNAPSRDRWAGEARIMLRAAPGSRFYRPPQDGQGTAASQTPEQLEKILMELLADVNNWKAKHVWSGVALSGFVEKFGTNQAAAAEALARLWPKARERFPELAPHVLAAIALNQVDTNAPIIAEFRQSLADYSKQPESVLHCGPYFEELAIGNYGWCLERRCYPLAIEVMQAKRQAALHSPKVYFHGKDGVKLAFGFVGLERWREALAAFEELGERPVDMDRTGPWGDAFKPFLPAKAAATCRKKLGLAPVELANRFDFGAPRVCMHTPSTFAVTDQEIWLAISGQLIHLDFELHTNFQVRLPVDDYVPLTALWVGADQIWIGTGGAGLLAYDKTSRKCRQTTDQDGLLRNDIACVSYHDQTLWIGFGNVEGGLGGLGKLDLPTGRLSTFTQPLLARPLNRVTFDMDKTSDPANGPPAHTVQALAMGSANEVWMLVAGYGLRSHRSAPDSWAPAQGEFGAGAIALASDGGERLIAGLSVDQVMVTLDLTSTAGAATNLVVRTNLMMSPAELKRWRADTNRSAQIWATYQDDRTRKGALGLYDFQNARWQLLADDGSLPRPVTQLLLDGSDIWAAGLGYVAVVDPSKNAVRKMCFIPSRTVDRLQIAGGYLWAQFDKHLYRVALSATR